jgi:small subunit ribosomal protein S9
MPTTVKKNPKKTDYIYAVGRRKTATARVRLYQKKGDLLVNGMAVGKYFPGEVSVEKYLLPLKLTGTFEKFSFSAQVEGGGKAAQLDAVVHGLSRAFSKLDREVYHISLKHAGLLTRDSRMKQSRMVGTGGKARRKKQSPKR